jgi:hypothetical protein
MNSSSLHLISFAEFLSIESFLSFESERSKGKSSEESPSKRETGVPFKFELLIGILSETPFEKAIELYLSSSYTEPSFLVL